MMEGVIFCCPPAWRKLLPPGVLGAERAEALAEQYWPLLGLRLLQLPQTSAPFVW